jgi:hypothetical protein
MRRAFYELRRTEALTGSRLSIWIQNVLEKRADVAWITASHPFVLGLLEGLMGPFVQIESIVLAGFPPVPKDQAGGVSAWHRALEQSSGIALNCIRLPSRRSGRRRRREASSSTSRWEHDPAQADGQP